MTIKITPSIDYNQVCIELGISVEDLISLVNKKNSPNLSLQNSMSFGEVIDEYLTFLKQKLKDKKRSETTYKTYTNFLNRLRDFITESENPKQTLIEFNEPQLLKFFESCKPRKGESLSIYTTNKYIAIVRSVYRFAFTLDYIDRDLSYRFDSDSSPLLPRHLSNDQVRKVLKHAKNRTYGYRYYTMIYFMLATGCRISEVTNLKVQNFNIKTNLIKVIGKGNKERYIPMYENLKKVVLQYFKMTHLIWSDDNDGYLFSRDDGQDRKKKISEDSLQYQVKNIFKDSGIKETEFSPHSFRHTFAVNCLKAGMKIDYLSQIMGHKDPATTSVYTKLHPEELSEEVNLRFPFPLEKLLSEFF